MAARAQLVKWGNSHAIRIPKEVIREANLREGEEMEIHVENGCIALAPVKPDLTLQELLKGITRKNLHSEQDWGRPAGSEIW